MKIQCTIIRDGGTKADIGGIEYHFEPLDDGAHVANVENKAHRDRFLSISEGYKIYDGDLEPVGKPVKLAVSVTNDAGDNRLSGARTSQTETLLGSSVHDASYEIGGETFLLGDVVASAHTKSGLSVQEWNDLEEEDRHAKIDIELDDLADAAEKAAEAKAAAGGGAGDDRAALVEQYKAKFGTAPHYRLSTENLKAKLAE